MSRELRSLLAREISELAMITGPQVRAARALLGWSQTKLSRQSGVSASVIRRFEIGRHQSHESTLIAIKAALAEGGVEFIGAVGVQIRTDDQRVKKLGALAN